MNNKKRHHFQLILSTKQHISKSELDIQWAILLTANGSGGCRAEDKKFPILSTCKLLICKQREFKGVLKSSGSWYSEKAS